MMKEQYTSPEVKLTSFVAEERVASSMDQTVDGKTFFGSIAKVNTEQDIPVFFDF